MPENLIRLILGHRERSLSEFVYLSVQKSPRCNPRRSPATRQKDSHSRACLKAFKEEARYLGLHRQMKVVDHEPCFVGDRRELLRDYVCELLNTCCRVRAALDPLRQSPARAR